jgi:SPOR domain
MWRLILFSALAVATARAATVDVVSLGPNKPSLVTVSGTFDPNDKDVFLRKIGSLPSAIVAFDSDGGSLIAGLQIGEIIRLKNFTTVVLDQTRCASSCALAWLGGTKRFMGTNARIGFHAAYNGETRQVTGPGNALVGAYLNKIGLPSAAVIYITTASPDSITWLSKPDAEKLGIEVSLFNGTPNIKNRDNAPAAGAYVVQISSQRSDEDARASYQVLQAKYPTLLGSYLPMIYRSDLGDKGVFYRAAVGPFQTPEDASRFCGDLKTAGGQCVVQRNAATEVSSPKETPKAANAPSSPGGLVLPAAISPKYSTESQGDARMHTALNNTLPTRPATATAA